MRPDNDATGPHMKLCQNHSDNLYDLQLLRDLQIINERTQRDLGLLSIGGLPVQPKRKPQLPRPAVPPVTPALPPSDEDTTMQWKSVAAVAVLATGSTLAACGAESTAAHVDPPAAAVPHAPASVQMPAVEAVPPISEATAAKPAASADEKAPEPARGPAIPAAQLRRQILALLGSFQSLKDLERDNVEHAFGIRMRKTPDTGEGFYQYAADTTDDWGYWIDISRLYGKDVPSTTVIYLDDGVESEADMPTHCTLEFEPLAKELVAMGYERGQRPRYVSSDRVWGFGRESAEGMARFGVGVSVYDVTLPDGTKQTCIKGFDIGGSSRDG